MLKEEISALLRVVAATLDSLNEQEYRDLLSGIGRLEYSNQQPTQEDPKQLPPKELRSEQVQLPQVQSEQQLNQPQLSKSQRKRQSKQADPTPEEVEKLVSLLESLRLAGDREEAARLLQESVKSKSELTELGKRIPVYIARSDTKAVIQEKIIEAIIGSKLAAEAIDELNMD